MKHNSKPDSRQGLQQLTLPIVFMLAALTAVLWMLFPYTVFAIAYTAGVLGVALWSFKTAISRLRATQALSIVFFSLAILMYFLPSTHSSSFEFENKPTSFGNHIGTSVILLSLSSLLIITDFLVPDKSIKQGANQSYFALLKSIASPMSVAIATGGLVALMINYPSSWWTWAYLAALLSVVAWYWMSTAWLRRRSGAALGAACISGAIPGIKSLIGGTKSNDIFAGLWIEGASTTATVVLAVSSVAFAWIEVRGSNQAPVTLPASKDLPRSRCLKKITVNILDQATRDLASYNYASISALSRIQLEYDRHQRFFILPFHSYRFPFHEHFLVVSWDLETATIERVIDLQDDHIGIIEWEQLASQYSTLRDLAYRHDPHVLLSDVETKRTIRRFREAIRAADKLVSALNSNGAILRLAIEATEVAEIAAVDGDRSSCTVKLEAALSHIHKILLTCTPEPTPQGSRDASTLPKEPNTAPYGPARHATNSSASKLQYFGDRLLLVDDNPQNAELLLSYLQELDCTIDIAQDGHEALDKMSKIEYDVVLLDIMMPRMSGFQVCSRIKSSPDTKDTIIIFVSALNELAEVERAMDAGAHDYITKPVNRIELKSRVTSCLRTRQLQRELQKALDESEKPVRE